MADRVREAEPMARIAQNADDAFVCADRVVEAARVPFCLGLRTQFGSLVSAHVRFSAMMTA